MPDVLVCVDGCVINAQDNMRTSVREYDKLFVLAERVLVYTPHTAHTAAAPQQSYA